MDYICTRAQTLGSFATSNVIKAEALWTPFVVEHKHLEALRQCCFVRCFLVWIWPKNCACGCKYLQQLLQKHWHLTSVDQNLKLYKKKRPFCQDR